VPPALHPTPPVLHPCPTPCTPTRGCPALPLPHAQGPVPRIYSCDMADEHFDYVDLPSEYDYGPEAERLVRRKLDAQLAGTGEHLTALKVPTSWTAVRGADHLRRWGVTYWTEPDTE
jgi:hypothetical protein